MKSPDANDVAREQGPDELRRQLDGAAAVRSGNSGSKKQPRLEARPYTWPDPAKIPPRRFLLGKHYARKSVSATIGGGGRLKTTIGLTEAIGMAASRDLIGGTQLEAPLRVWFLSGEETQDELDIRVAAICQHFGISQTNCGDRLFVQSVRNKTPRFATLDRNRRALINQPALDQLETEIKAKRFDVFILDPLVSFHSVNENSNEDMDNLVKEGFGAIADRADCGIEVLHHTGKPKPGQTENTVEDARGASALVWAVRSARVLNFMTTDEAKRLGIPEDDRRLHIRISNGKANVGPIGKADWVKISVEKMANGDEVACGSSWKPQNPFDGVSTAAMYECRELTRTGAYRYDSRSDDWIGYAIAQVLKINVVYGAKNDPKDLARIKQILATWLKNKVLKTEKRKDETRHDKTFVVPGPWQDDSSPDTFDDEDVTLQ
jgi:hypothetical protein